MLFLLSEAELRHVLRDSAASYAVTTSEFLDKVAAAAPGVETCAPSSATGRSGDLGVPLLDFAELESADEGDLVDTEPSGLAAPLCTGGTTGRAKGVMLSHDAPSSAAWAAIAAGRDNDADSLSRSLLPLPHSHVYG